ncbi:HlyD family secretion protein [Carboxydocella sporoproducens DSM 16521]|uniref:HlyD family secretion protein n=3 Tax=Clostridiales Family XVI. Incertae Sedis TaxID=543347 RepID=A0A1T4PL84_9FIRM|nr:HlyD family secretion protein [Carboxydocella thermautotrophica]SJZ92344.1 HlyD family secretion protein [Carboxydocella sporoproducens DSM 16521]
MMKGVRIVVVLLVLAGLGWYGWLKQQGKPAEDVYNGWVEGEEYRVVAETAGKVKEVLVKEGELVKAGQVVAKLDDEAARLQLALAQANRAAAEARAGDVKAGSRPQQIAQAQAQVRALQASLQGALENLKRLQSQRQDVEELVQTGGATADQLEAAKAAEASAQAAVNSLKAQIDAAREQVRLLQAGATSYSLSAQDAQVEAARQQEALAQLQVNKARVVAPVRGVVQNILLKVGELANPGSTLLNLVDQDRLYVNIFVPQSQLDRVQLGRKAIVEAENGKLKGEGKIVYISPQGEFTPKNIQTREERATQVFKVKVEITSGGSSGFKPGQAVEVRLK